MPAHQLACEDVGNGDCAFLVRSDDRDEVAELARTHASDVHGETYTREAVLNAVSEVEWSPA